MTLKHANGLLRRLRLRQHNQRRYVVVISVGLINSEGYPVIMTECPWYVD
jgi:hypothetical protein